jgi:hypothetical protein
MSHEFVEWPGYYAQEKYCKHCGEWQSKANPFRCSTSEPLKSVQTYDDVESKSYPYIFDTILIGLDNDDFSKIGIENFAFSWIDTVTLLEFEDGTKRTPSTIWNATNIPYNKRFRFYRIRQSWRDQYGITADEYHDDVTPAPTNTTLTGSSTSSRWSNSNAGVSNGTQSWFNPTKGLGGVPTALEDGDSVFTSFDPSKHIVYIDND